MVRKHENMNLYATNSSLQNTITEGKIPSGVTALTWGVFPNREIVQPTIFDPNTFFSVWADEAFSLWISMWLSLYDYDNPSYAIVEEIHSTYFLCAIIDNDFMRQQAPGDSNNGFDNTSSTIEPQSLWSKMSTSLLELT